MRKTLSTVRLASFPIILLRRSSFKSEIMALANSLSSNTRTNKPFFTRLDKLRIATHITTLRQHSHYSLLQEYLWNSSQKKMDLQKLLLHVNLCSFKITHMSCKQIVFFRDPLASDHFLVKGNVAASDKYKTGIWKSFQNLRHCFDENIYSFFGNNSSNINNCRFRVSC